LPVSGNWAFCDFSGKRGSDRHSCLSNSSLKELRTGKNACLYFASCRSIKDGLAGTRRESETKAFYFCFNTTAFSALVKFEYSSICLARSIG
jgi:hypothetical protein